ncbi:MAG: CBS domain-containing protein [Luteitalea sp.]|nr:CBS domain-containing protein [Luteitalea sp.]
MTVRARLRQWRRRVQVAFLRLTGLSRVAEENYLLLAAIGVGILAGLGSAAFMYSLRGVHHLFFDSLAGRLGALGPSAVVLLPALGGLIVGPLIARFAPEARGHGVPEVMTAVATRGGRIQGRVAVVKTAASAISIGSGGSAGQEGPMVQIGASLASALGHRLGIPAERMRTFVACGAAGGLAAVFNAPIGGAIFALEVITGELTPAFGAVILSSISATVVSRSLFGNYPSFVVPRYDVVSDVEMLFYALLGLLAGLAATGFIRTLYALEERFDRWELPAWSKPALGGLMVGIVGRFAPDIFGTGSETIQGATWGTLGPAWLLALLVPLKIVSTSLTLASGGSGGVFGPSMYIGAVLGGAFGWLVHLVFPTVTAGSGAYALVGIGAVVGGTALAPLTAIILLFEMTDDYRIILPSMLATVVAIVVTRRLVGESIYTLKLRQQNIAYYAGQELERVHAFTVEQAMRKNLPAVAPSTSVLSALSVAVQARAPALPVVDAEHRVIGVVSMDQLSAAAVAEKRPASLDAIMTRASEANILVSDRLVTALTRLSESDSDALVVVRSETDAMPVGVVSRRDVMRIYERVLRRR